MYSYFQSRSEFEEGFSGVCIDSAILEECCVEEKNTSYRLELTLNAKNKLSQIVEQGGYIAATDLGVKQLFKCSKPYPKLDVINVKCEHALLADGDAFFVRDTNVVRQTGTAGMNQILGATSRSCKNVVNITSDIKDVFSARYVRKNLISECILDGDNSFLNTWGGILKFKNYKTAEINATRGIDRTYFKFVYGRDVTGMTGFVDYGVITEIVPEGFDGLLLPNNETVKSTHINDYELVYTQKRDYPEIKYTNPEEATPEEGDYTVLEDAYAALRAAARKDFTESKLDVPRVCLTIDVDSYVVDGISPKLSSVMTNFEIGDKVGVHIKLYNIDVETEVVATSRSLLQGKLKSIVIGDIITSTLDNKATNSNLKNQIERVNRKQAVIADGIGDFVSQAEFEAGVTKAMADGLGNSNVIVRRNELLVGSGTSVATMNGFWWWTKDGLAYVKGKYGSSALTTAITPDGTVYGGVVRAGTIQATSGYSFINLDNGRFNFGNYLMWDGTSMKVVIPKNGYITLNDSENKKSLEYTNGYFRMYDPKDGSVIGRMGRNKWKNNTNVYGLDIGNTSSAYTALSRYDSSSGSYITWMLLNFNGNLKDNSNNPLPVGIHWYEDMDFHKYCIGQIGKLIWEREWHPGSPDAKMRNRDEWYADDSTGQYQIRRITNASAKAAFLNYDSNGNLNALAYFQANGIDFYRNLDMHNWRINNAAGVAAASVSQVSETPSTMAVANMSLAYDEPVESEALETDEYNQPVESSVFSKDDDYSDFTVHEYKTVTAFQNNREFIGTTYVELGEGKITLPQNVVYSQYVVTIQPIGKHNVYIQSKTNDEVILKCDETRDAIEVDFIIKFILVDADQSLSVSLMQGTNYTIKGYGYNINFEEESSVEQDEPPVNPVQ